MSADRAPDSRDAPQSVTEPSFRFFENRECEYWPCHELGRINCLFCFCPLYPMEDCGGSWALTDSGIKDCSSCTLPHGKGGYDYVIARLSGPAGSGEDWL